MTSERVRSDCFEAGIGTWRLRMYPEGYGRAKGTHLSVFLEAQDVMWAPSVEYAVTLVHQAEASRSFTYGGMPCDVTLKLPCGAEVPSISLFLQTASPFLRGALEDMSGSGLIPVDGSLGSWTYILSDLYLQHDAPLLTLDSVYLLLPVVHKYNFTKLLTWLVAFVKEKSTVLVPDPDLPHNSIMRWLALAERVQLDELREVCLSRLRGMTRKQLEQAILIPGAGAGKKCGVREEVQRLGPALWFELLAITAKECNT
ncbi:hypothetical protein FOA52_000528 [Chlamydomonas sp. UWO 241]|nr:hypothetical protein FOA52_000528 [Chlamydomonas sp. UWO 241]